MFHYYTHTSSQSQVLIDRFSRELPVTPILHPAQRDAYYTVASRKLQPQNGLKTPRKCKKMKNYFRQTIRKYLPIFVQLGVTDYES
jgi:hypothetical protein